MTTRKAPLRELPVNKTINVEQFGAIANDGKCDYSALKKAFEAVIAESDSVALEFELNGHYEIDPPIPQGGWWHAFVLENASNLWLKGNGASITCKNPAVGFLRFKSASKVVVSHLSIDYDPIPWTEGWITSPLDSENSTFTYKVRDGFPDPDQNYFKEATQRYGYLLDPEIPGRLKTDSYNYYAIGDTTKNAKGEFEIALATPRDDDHETLQIGDRFVIMARRNSSSLFVIAESQDITFKNITNYSATSVCYASVRSEAINFIECKTLIKGNRWKSSNADGIHIQSNRVGPWVENCTFEGLGDDGFNMYTNPYVFTEQRSETGFKLERLVDMGRSSIPFKSEGYRNGDLLTFWEPMSGSFIAEARITKLEPNGWVELDTPIPGIKLGKTKNATQIFNNSLSDSFVIKDSSFRDLRRHGVFLKASNGIISNNSFSGLCSDAITIHNDPWWPEGPGSRNLLIENNIIDTCGFSRLFFTQEPRAIISIYNRDMNHAVSKSARSQKHIIIRNNTLTNWNRRAIFISNSEHVTISENKLVPKTAQFLKSELAAIEVQRSSYVKTKSNDFMISPILEMSEIVLND